jgi:hypothetical protein
MPHRSFYSYRFQTTPLWIPTLPSNMFAQHQLSGTRFHENLTAIVEVRLSKSLCYLLADTRPP